MTGTRPTVSVAGTRPGVSVAGTRPGVTVAVKLFLPVAAVIGTVFPLQCYVCRTVEDSRCTDTDEEAYGKYTDHIEDCGDDDDGGCSIDRAEGTVLFGALPFNNGEINR